MSDLRHIKSALISVFHKDGLEPIVAELKRLGVTIYSTGGTQTAIEAMGAEVVPVESVTDYPSILGGRVKTLHPKVFGGILNRRNHEGDQAQMAEYNLPNIDLVVVDLLSWRCERGLLCCLSLLSVLKKCIPSLGSCTWQRVPLACPSSRLPRHFRCSAHWVCFHYLLRG